MVTYYYYNTKIIFNCKFYYYINLYYNVKFIYIRYKRKKAATLWKGLLLILNYFSSVFYCIIHYCIMFVLITMSLIYSIVLFIGEWWETNHRSSIDARYW
jgi:hypothetical protein